jgi:phage tail-like protein
VSESAPERTAAATPGTFVEPYRAYQFKLQVSGFPGIQGHFTACSGISVEIPRIEYREGGNQQVTHHLPGQPRYGPITLQWGVTSELRVLWDWVKAAASGRAMRQNVSIVQLDAAGTTEVLRCNAMDTWPTYFSYAELDARSHEAAIAKLVIAVTTLDIVHS